MEGVNAEGLSTDIVCWVECCILCAFSTLRKHIATAAPALHGTKWNSHVWSVLAALLTVSPLVIQSLLATSGCALRAPDIMLCFVHLAMLLHCHSCNMSDSRHGDNPTAPSSPAHTLTTPLLLAVCLPMCFMPAIGF